MSTVRSISTLKLNVRLRERRERASNQDRVWMMCVWMPIVLALAVEVETLARIYLQARAIGEPPLLSAEQMEQVRHQFRTLLYGN